MAIKLEHVNYIYGADTELSVAALKDVCISIEDGQFIGLIGHTGSGKSTLVQHLNGRTWGFPGKRRKAGPGKRWSLWESVRNIISSHPLTCPAGRKEEWPLRACLP